MSHDEVMTDIFRPIGAGTAILHEEWKNGEQLTTTVFYLVGSEVWTRSRHAAAADTIVQSIPPRASAVIHAIEPVSPKPKGSST